MRVAVTSGRLAGPLADGLAEAGHDVVRLVEREAYGPGERRWDPDCWVVELETDDIGDLLPMAKEGRP